MSHALFMSYNAIGKDNAFTNGTFERNGQTVTILQHPKGQRWGGAIDDLPPTEFDAIAAGMSPAEQNQSGAKAGALRRETIAVLERELVAVSTPLDFLVVYVGASGSQGAIEVARRYPIGIVRFVMCSCGFEEKLYEIAHVFGIHDLRDLTIPILRCECGGHRTMERLVNDFITTGHVGPPAV